MTTRQERNSRRRNRWIGAACAVVIFVGLGVAVTRCDPAPENPPPVAFCPPLPGGEVLTTMFANTNDVRAFVGLNRLTWNAQLTCHAIEHSQWMRDNNSFTHTDLYALIRSSGYEHYSSLGENILVGPDSLTGQQVQDAFMASPAHRANILGYWNSVGMGIAYGTDGRMWVTVDFGLDF